VTEVTQETPSAISGHLLQTARSVFARWFGPKYDLRVLDAVLCTAAAQRLGGDPCWLLVVGGPGAAKTETIMALCNSGAVMISTITGEAALLSGTSQKDRAPDATGGLLGKVGSEGMMVIKDFTTIISQGREQRAQVLAALREIYDGKWNREVGTDGGRTLSWEGKLVLIGAVTTAWDAAHTVISSMGDRFVLIRIDSTENRREAGMQALRNVSHETEMRADLAAAVTEALGAVQKDAPIDLVDAEMYQLLDLADVVTLARTAVERDFQGNVVQAHAPEMPTRFLKQLAQITRGGIALGMDRAEALDVAIRCAGDSMPPMRLAVLGDILAHPLSLYGETAKRLQLPRKSIERVMQELHLLGLLAITEEKYGQGERWRYSIAQDISVDVLGKLARNGGPSSQGDAKSAPKVARNGGGASKSDGGKAARNGGPPAHEEQLTAPTTPPVDVDEPAPAKPRTTRKPAKKKLPKQKCEHCRKSFTPAKLPAKYCRQACRTAAYTRRKKRGE